MFEFNDKEQATAVRNCPVCNVPMRKVVIGGSIVLDECEKCHGVFFDNLELKKLDEEHEFSDDPELQRLLSYERADDRRDFQLTCPACGSKMVRRRYNIRSDVFIDECYNCGGIWLDAGELKAIREQFLSREDAKKAVEELIYSTPGIADEIAEFESRISQRDELLKARRKGTISLFRFIGSVLKTGL